jgi:hypothetical protein
MPTTKRIFIPFGELTPDAREFNNEGLTQATNVAPIGDTYVLSQYWKLRTAALPHLLGQPPKGLWIHPSTSSTTWYGYWGNINGSLYEVSNTSAAIWTVTDKTRLAAVYLGDAWHGTSFGDSVIMTNYSEDVQLLTSPAAANFVKLAQSGGGNPGMDPKAKFAFPVRSNMFLLNLNLAAPFDGLSAGANPNVVAWSQSENARQYGSFNVTPQLTGCGYQPLNYDSGAITGGVGGQYALISMQRGWARVDGPPYTFRPISQGVGNQCSNGIIRFDNDVYFWGPNGPMVFRDGEGPAIPIAKDKLSRTLTDAVFGSPYSCGVYGGADPFLLSAGADHVNRQVWWAFSAGISVDGELLLMYDVDTQRFTFQTPRQDGDPATICGALSLQTRPEQPSGWTPGRDLVCVMSVGPFPSEYYLATPFQSATPVTATFEKGYMQLDENQTQRIVRARPIYSMNDPSIVPTASITISSKNKPFEAPTVKGPYTTLDSHGWITTPDTVFADFHRPKLTFSGISSRVTEISGLEIEIGFGGSYAA